MTIRDVLVYVDETPASQARVDAAVRLADRHQARITGVFLRSEFSQTFWASDAVTYAAAIDLPRIVQEQDLAVLAASETARTCFEAAAAERAVTSDWLVIDGDTDGPVIDLARRFDLAVMPIRARPLLSENIVQASGIALASGGPVLATPEAGYSAELGRKVMVAWKNSRESARALRDAWPILAAAQEVRIVSVAQDGELDPDSSLQRHFEHHGVAAKLVVVRKLGETPADALRREALEFGADLVVMGVFGHSRLAEFVLGGVSGELLTHPPCPVLISH